VPIPKKGGVSTLGVPTIADRIAQTVVAERLGPRMEEIFHADSYGYRPGRSAIDAVRTCRRRCWEHDWVIDLDVAKFFDTCPHDLILKAVEANTDQKWILLYVKRWLVAPLQHPDGTLQVRDRGTPQGSAVSPCLANLFLHYAFDAWMARTWPSVRFERYVDDAVVHCASQRQALVVQASIAARMAEVGLELHPTKTKVSTAGTATGGVGTTTSRSISWGMPSVPGRQSTSGRTRSSPRSLRRSAGTSWSTRAERFGPGAYTGTSMMIWPTSPNGSTRSCEGG
jgi:RNA-directed DNA polymerase